MPGFANNGTISVSTNTSLTANSTIAVSTNTSTSEASQFSFIIPYNQTQACDIYGPLCQTGSITVGVDLTSQTSTTVLPCSSYLTAQSSFLVSSPDDVTPDDDDYDYIFDNWPTEWQTNFGRSPECHSYAQGQYTISNCGSGYTSVIPAADQLVYDPNGYPVQVPPGVVRYWTGFEIYSCCGDCSLEVEETRLYYFPDGTTTECHHNQTSNSTSVLSTGNVGKRAQSLVRDGSIAVVSGHTLYARPYVPPCL